MLLLLSVSFRELLPDPERVRLKLPGSSFSLYLLLFMDIMKIDFGTTVPKVKFMFSSPFTNVLY